MILYPGINQEYFARNLNNGFGLREIKMKILRNLFIGFSLLVITCGSVWAQATAQIGGTVADPTGALLPGVEVTATQTATGVTRLTLTNETATYVLPNLPLGPYRLEATLPGFQTFVQTGIVLQVGNNVTINIELEVGQVTQTIEVTASTTLVETRNLSVGQVMTTERIVALPLNGRNVQQLLVLQGGAVQAHGEGGISFSVERVMITTAGGLITSTETKLDGIRHVDPYDGAALPLPFPEALGEFRTGIGGQEASQGLGARVSAVTTSGTNQFHGNLFLFNRDDAYSARHYFAGESSLRRNQFGGTIGGPILSNKLFFFAGYQGTRIEEDAGDNRQILPTAEMLAGDFTTHVSAACNPKALTMNENFPDGTPTGFINNVIDPALFDPIALALVARLPSSGLDECGEITFSSPNKDNRTQYMGKMDYQASDQHSLFGRYLYTAYEFPQSFNPENVFTADTIADAQAYAFTAGSTYLIGAATVNSARLSVSRVKRFSAHEQLFSMSELGSKVFDGYSPKNVGIGITSGFDLSFGTDRDVGTQLYQIADDVSMVRGNHQFGFGGSVGHSRQIFVSGSGRVPQFRFTGLFTGRGLGDFLLGKLARINQVTGHFARLRQNFASLYVQDTWQVMPRLTISAGLRWEPILPHIDNQRPVPYVVNYNEENFVQGIRSQVFVNAPPGLLFPGDSQFEQSWNENLDKPMGNLWNPYWNGWAPRVGLAWDIQGDGRTSLRASYGLSFINYPGNSRLGTQTSMPPHGGSATNNSPGSLADPWSTFPGGNPHPRVLDTNLVFPARTEIMPEKAQLTPTYTQTFNLSLQREVVSDLLLSVSYIGNLLFHTQATQSLNQSLFVPGVGDASGNCFLNGAITHFTVVPGEDCSTVFNTQTRRRLTFLRPDFEDEFGRLAQRDNGGTQNYHGMIVAIERRAARGINLNANYTWSHCIGDYLGRGNSGYGSSADHAYLDPNNRAHDRGNCRMDQRNAFNLYGVFSMPEFANRTLNLLAGGWRLSPIYKLTSDNSNSIRSNQSSGQRTVTLGRVSSSRAAAEPGVDRCLCDASNQRPDQILENVYLDTSGDPGTQYLNPDAFGKPEVGTLGNMGRDALKLPNFFQFDVSLARIFNFRETQSVEVRVEAYNVLNSFRTGGINTDFSSSRFGKIRTALDPRQLQFALKYNF